MINSSEKNQFSLQSLLKNLDTKIDVFRTDFDDFRKDVKQHFVKNEKDFNDFRNEVYHFQNEVYYFQKDVYNFQNYIQSKIDNLDKRIHGNFSILSSSQSTGTISVVNIYNSQGFSGSGVLVEIDSELYFATCAHVIIDETKDYLTITKIKEIKLLDGTNLFAEGPIYIFSLLDNQYQKIKHDYALIKIIDFGFLTRAAHISKSKIDIGLSLKGITYIDSKPVYNEGKVFERDDTYVNLFHSDLGGTYGYSGSGYFDEDGYLRAIHHGAGYFLGQKASINNKNSKINIPVRAKEEYENSVFFNSIQETFQYCTSAFQDKKFSFFGLKFGSTINYRSKKFKKCSFAISILLKKFARNPRTAILDSSLFFNLRYNTTGKSIIVYQGLKIDFERESYTKYVICTILLIIVVIPIIIRIWHS